MSFTHFIVYYITIIGLATVYFALTFGTGFLLAWYGDEINLAIIRRVRR